MILTRSREEREGGKMEKNVEELSAEVVDAAFHLHKDLGPGLLESVYDVILAKMLEERGMRVERQKPIPISYAGLRFNEGFRADLLVEGKLLVELKSVDNLTAVHARGMAAGCGQCVSHGRSGQPGFAPRSAWL